MVAARTAAMSFNRLVDRRLDATNPRTALRPSVTGEVRPRAMCRLTLVAATLYILAAYALNPLCGWLSWPSLVVLLGYSLAKRFTSLSHGILGLALGLSPLGACLAARGRFDREALAAALLGAAVLAWTTGFDVFYACQDVEHDRAEGLHSIPARIGVGGALWVSRGTHLLVPLFLLLARQPGGLGGIYLWTVGLVALLLIYEHSLLRSNSLSRMGAAFFKVNVAISLLVMLGVISDRLLGGSF